MAWEFADETDARIRIPASLTVSQLHVGDGPRVRFLRGYGSAEWYRVQDGIREPSTIDLVGVLATDRDEAGAQALVDALVAAAETAEHLVQVDAAGGDVQTLPLLGVLPIITSPDGIDGTLLTITLPLIPGGDWVSGSPVTDSYLLLDSGGVMLLDSGGRATQQ